MTAAAALDDRPAAVPADLAAAVAAARPAVLRGFVDAWPGVAAGRRGPSATHAWLAALDQGGEAEVFVGPPEIRGRFFYGEGLSGFNFQRQRASVTGLLQRLAAVADHPTPPALYMGSAPVRESLPGFLAAHPAPAGVPEAAPPRIWLGNAVAIQTHYDLSDNLACVVAGRRVFTLFPPDQTANLYVGPLDFTPAGQPISLVDPDAPDLARFPRFREAAAAAMTATLEPGDALYIPPLWWHHVRSVGPLNVLVNYWWNGGPAGAASGFDSLVHALAAIRCLPPERREAWRAMFEHYVFSADERSHAHLPPASLGVLGPLTPALGDRIRRFLIAALSRG